MHNLFPSMSAWQTCLDPELPTGTPPVPESITRPNDQLCMLWCIPKRETQHGRYCWVPNAFKRTKGECLVCQQIYKSDCTHPWNTDNSWEVIKGAGGKHGRGLGDTIPSLLVWGQGLNTASREAAQQVSRAMCYKPRQTCRNLFF